MFGIKFTAILLITAIFNPLCCCLDLTAKDAEPAPQPEHSCCATAPDSGKTDANQHTQADCPHESEKNSQISEAANAHDSIAKTQASHAALLYTFELLPRDTDREATQLPHLDKTSSLPTTPVAEEYCVYIL